MDPAAIFGIYVLCVLAAAGAGGLVALAFIGARQLDRERRAGREHLRTLAGYERDAG